MGIFTSSSKWPFKAWRLLVVVILKQMRTIVLVALIAIAVAGGVLRNNRVVLQSGVQNNINFACGTYAVDGTPNVLNQAYTYTFSNLPNWCNAQGNILSGIPPAGAAGPWPINVQYQGPKGNGWSSFLLCLDSNVNWNTNGLSWITYLQGTLSNWNIAPANNGNWVVLLPLVSNSYPNGIVCADQANTHNRAQDKVNEVQGQLNDLNKKLSDAQALVANLNNQIASKQNELNNANNDEKDTYSKWDTCRSNSNIIVQNKLQGGSTTISNGIFGSVISTGGTTISTGTGGSFISTPGVSIATNGNLSTNCGSIQSTGQGSGTVVSVGSNFLVLNNGVRLNFGGCTTKKYRSGRQNFAVADTISYDLYNQAGNVFARSVTCQCQ